MDKKTANNIIVGIFVLVGVVAFIFVLFTMNGGQGLFAHDYILHAKFDDVKGLNYGSEVSLGGLRAGAVRKITVENVGDTKDLVVELGIALDMQDKIRGDSEASILTSGVLGDKYVEITIGSPSQPVLKDGDLIKSEQPPDLFSKGGTLVDDINRHFKKGSDVDMLLDRLNRVADHLAMITGQLETSKTGLWAEVLHGSSGAKISSASDHLNSILKKIDTGEGSLGALINDPSVYEDLKTMMGGAKRSAILKYFMRSFIESGKDGAPPENASKKE